MIYIAETASKNISILEKLFAWKYFEPVLFSSIGVLLVLLFIVLFLGKKDQKKKIEETKQLELNALTEQPAVDAFAKENVEPETVEIKEDIEPVVIEDSQPMNMETASETSEVVDDVKIPDVTTEENPMPDFEIFKTPEVTEAPIEEPAPVVAETPVISETPVAVEEPLPEPVAFEAPVVEEIPPVVSEPAPVVAEVPVVDDAIQSVVIKDDDALKNEIVNTAEASTDPLNEERINSFKENFADLASSISKELDEINKMQESARASSVNTSVELPKEVDVTPINNATKFTPSEVFSSVYTPNSIKTSEPVDEGIELPKLDANNTNPLADEMPIKKEDIELPKPAVDTPTSVNSPDFSSFGNETFEIK